MKTPILDRPNVTSLLDVEKLEDCYPDNVFGSKITESIEDFCSQWGFSEVVIQHDNDIPPLGIILDAYDGEDNVDTRTIWFMDYELPF